MHDCTFVGAFLRMKRLERDWSQETLCHGICAVSYLSKIEQGKVAPNEALLRDLFSRLQVRWQDPSEQNESNTLCEDLYEAVFSCNNDTALISVLEKQWNETAIGPSYLDFATLRAYFHHDPSLIPGEMISLLDERQQCLYFLIREMPEKAMQAYPNPLAAYCASAKVYSDGNYTLALEYSKRAYDLACEDGYVQLMIYTKIIMANCYSDLRSFRAMETHSRIALRLARAVGDLESAHTITYNLVSTQMEHGEYQEAYEYLSMLENPSVLDLHKLAICCEMLDKPQEALIVLDHAEKTAFGVEKLMCSLVRYRLEHTEYLHDADYGKLLLDTFEVLRRERPMGFARFHLPWVEAWCTANRQYRLAYEILRDFT